MTPPDLYESTHFVLDDAGRIVSTREPHPSPGPLLSLVRGSTRVVWTLRADLPAPVAQELGRLARAERPASDLRSRPANAEPYLTILRNSSLESAESTRQLRIHHGPAFEFPASLGLHSGVVAIEDEFLLERHFRGWIPGEIAGGRSPVVAVLDDGHPVSVCFCARRSEFAAEAGVETAVGFRGRGLAPQVTAAWALAVRASGRTPLYSTAWQNEASLAVARKLDLIPYANHWRVHG